MLEQIQNTDLSQKLYDFFQNISILSSFIFGIWYRKKYKIKFLKYLVAIIILYALLLGLTNVMFWIECGFPGSGTVSIVRALGYVIIFAYPVAKLIRIGYKTLIDFVAPLFALSTGICLFGCVFAGCCAGYPCSWGIYNDKYGGTAFPVQIFDAITVLLIFAIMLWWNKKVSYSSDGRSYPLMMILFGSTRFLWEFATNNIKIWIGCSSIAFHALFMAVAGGIVLYYLKKTNENRGDTK